jgi:hypothetical protein
MSIIYEIRLFLTPLRFLCYFTFILKRAKPAEQVCSEYQHEVTGNKQTSKWHKHNEDTCNKLKHAKQEISKEHALYTQNTEKFIICVYVVLTGDFSFSLASDDAHGHKQRLV